MQPILYIFVGLMCGAILLGLGIFFWMLLDAIKTLNRTVSELAPLGKSLNSAQLSAVMAILPAALPDLIKGMDGINQMLKIFCQFAFANNTRAGTGAVTTDTDSGYYGYNEADAAARERVAEAVRGGVPTEAAEEVINEHGKQAVTSEA